MKFYGSLLLTWLLATPLLAAPTCFNLFSGEHIKRSQNYENKNLRRRKSFSVITWNLNRFFVERPDKYKLPHVRQKIPEGLDNLRPKSPGEIKQYREAMKDLDADVYVFQEVIGSYSTRALDPRNEYNHYVDTPSDAFGMQTVFLVRKGLNVAAKVYQTESAKKKNVVRGLPVLSLRQKNADGKIIDPESPDLLIMGLHLKTKARMPEALYEKVKAEEVRAILQVYREFNSLFQESPFLVAGDMNANVLSSPHLIPMKNAFRESLEMVRASQNEAYRATQVFYDHKGETIASQLDAIFLNPKSQERLRDSFVYHYRLSTGEAKDYKNKNGERVPYPVNYELRSLQQSDHFPVASVFDMRY